MFNKLFIVLLVAIFGHHAAAKTPKECQRSWTEAPVTKYTTQAEVKFLMSNLEIFAPKTTLNSDQWNRYKALLEELEKDLGPIRYISGSLKENICDFPKGAAAQDPALAEKRGPIKQIAFEIESNFNEIKTEVGKLTLDKMVFIKGRVFTSSKCSALDKCSDIYQIYIDEVGVRVDRYYFMGAESGAGGGSR